MVAGLEVIQRLYYRLPLTKASLTMAANEGAICRQQDQQYGSIPQSDQFSSVAQLCLTLCDLMDCSTPSFPVHHQLPELDQTHVH